MASEILKLTAQIVMSHASVSALKPEELTKEIENVYNTLASLEGEAKLEVPGVKGEEAEVKKPPIPLKDIVTAKYVTCLECGKKMRSLKNHLRKAHNLMPKEYYRRYGLDPKKFPLVCREYSEKRSMMTKERGFGTKGGRRKAAGSA